ncbi:hypothetical protein CC86DRAFT_399440 [Ophiobolus disseminans]|uniref:Uncharacterized protein n=1 Tax=Ophiobolus disseminans TaxID=1469910 RepID=A0A6A7AHS7_9PLEO|nr:hypothetical protein CC86DRAFT_399440 [Ophiobolus disseminans]
MLLSTLLTVAVALVLAAHGRVLGSSSLSANVAESLETLDIPNGPPERSGKLQARFDPAKFADDAMWKKYVDKGHHLKCIMEAPDRAAGFLQKDTRTPPSAAIAWKGDLKDAYQKWY